MFQSRRARRPLAMIALPVVGMSLAAAACGDDEESAATTQATLTEAEFLEQGNAICAEANATIGVSVGELFDAGDPTPEAMQEVLDVIVTTTRQAADEIAALAAPAALRDDVNA